MGCLEEFHVVPLEFVESEGTEKSLTLQNEVPSLRLAALPRRSSRLSVGGQCPRRGETHYFSTQFVARLRLLNICANRLVVFVPKRLPD